MKSDLELQYHGQSFVEKYTDNNHFTFQKQTALMGIEQGKYFKIIYKGTK